MFAINDNDKLNRQERSSGDETRYNLLISGMDELSSLNEPTSINLDSLLVINNGSPMTGGGSSGSGGANQQYQQQQPTTTMMTQRPVQPAQPTQYRRIRPEPINERTLVGSVVGFIQEVVSGETSQAGHPAGANKRHPIASANSSSSQSSSHHMVAEIKEQIEWLHFENINLLDSFSSPATSANSASSSSSFANSNILLVLGYKTGFSVWTIDLNGVASEVLSIREPNIKHVKLLKLENNSKVLMAICKLILSDSVAPTASNAPAPSSSSSSSAAGCQQSLVIVDNTYTSISPNNHHHHQTSSPTSSSSPSSVSSMQHSSSSSASSSSCSSSSASSSKYNISIVDLLTGECLREIVFNGDIIELKSNSSLLCVNSWNRLDAFDLNTFEHRFTLNTCYSQISKSTGKQINPFSLGNRWIAFADNKFHGILASIGGVSTDIEQSYTATVLNTAKSISKGLVKISETVVNSMVSKSKSTTSNGGHSPRMNGAESSKQRHDSKEEYQAGICTIVDTKKYTNTNSNAHNLHEENQNWIVAHFPAHQECIHALEFNPNGRLLVSADSLGQYFNVFQINSSPYKCTRTVVKHLYSLYRGDTSAKVRNVSFSNDSRWLAIGTKRGTTHIFPINPHGGPVNARTHSKPYVVNRVSKHQRTAGFIDQEDILNLNGYTHSNGQMADQQLQQQLMMQQQYDSTGSSSMVINNNPKLKTLLEPFVIPTYGQLKQPNANSSFQSSVISASGAGVATPSSTSLGQQSLNANGQNATALTLNPLLGITGSNLAASALTSAVMVTENVTNFASNTTNMIQYDNVCAVSVFAESRGYLSPEEPRDFASNRLKPANSLFVISDVNGNLVEYVLDVIVDTSKMAGNKPTNDSPIQLKITPKAQWPLQRFVSSDEIKYPLNADNPLILNGLNKPVRKPSCNDQSPMGSYSPNSLISNSSSSPSSSLFTTAPNSLAHIQASANPTNEWIKLIEVNTHIGPHRRLFMGPQFAFKTFNSNLTTMMLNPTSSSVIGDTETPIVDLSGDIELNSLDLSAAAAAAANITRKHSNSFHNHYNHSTSPMLIKNKLHQKIDCTPTYIEVGAGSFQEGMPIMCGSVDSHGSQKSLNTCDLLGDNLIESIADAMSELNTSSHIVPTQVNTKNNTTNNGSNKTSGTKLSSPAIAISNKPPDATNHLLLMNAANSIPTVPVAPSSSVGSNSSGVFTVGSYFLVNPTLANGPTVNTSLTSCTSSSSASSSSSTGRTSNGSAGRNSNGSNTSGGSNPVNDDADSIASSTHGSLSRPVSNPSDNEINSFEPANIKHHHHHNSIENNLFQDDNNLLH